MLSYGTRGGGWITRWAVDGVRVVSFGGRMSRFVGFRGSTIARAPPARTNKAINYEHSNLVMRKMAFWVIPLAVLLCYGFHDRDKTDG